MRRPPPRSGFRLASILSVIRIDLDPTHIGRRHPVTIGAVGDIKPTLQALLPRLEQHEDEGFLAVHVERHQRDVAAAKAEMPSGLHSAISGTYLTKLINKHAAEDAPFAADNGTAALWMLRHIDTGGKRRTFASLLHGAMANGMPSAIGLQKSQPGRQVVCLAGDGGFTMLLGELLTIVQEHLPIKIAVYDNGKLGLVDIEQKAAGLVPVYTDLKNPDFAKVATAVGLWGRFVSKGAELEESVETWLAQRGPALLHVKVKPMQLVTPPSAFASPEAVVGMAVYTARAMFQGNGHDVWEMMVENLP
jgi:pyruvate dehydrogenase (quinone)